MGNLQDKAIIITGAGRGMGEAHARLAAAEGARVVVNDIDVEEAERVADVIRSEGGEARAHAADISAWHQAEALVQFCVSAFGSLDGFVNNAAVFHMAPPEKETEAQVRRIFEVNVLGTAYCGYAALRHMLSKGSGSLVNISSGAHAGIRCMSAYGASKGAVTSLTFGWALDVEGTGVRVNAVSPMALTRMVKATAKYFRDNGLGHGPRVSVPPENNSPVVLYLLSDLSKGINGQVVRVQGSAMNLMTHPAALNPGVKCNRWSIASVARAFASTLKEQQLPLGVQSYDVKIRPYLVPYSCPKSPRENRMPEKVRPKAAVIRPARTGIVKGGMKHMNRR